MKIHSSRRGSRGFSLMELIVVVAIIIILAGLTMAGFALVNQQSARKKAKLQLELIGTALETYNSENRSYPPSPDPMGEKGDEVLYKYLYFDGFEARDSGGVIYMPEFDPGLNSVTGEGKGGQNWIQRTGAQVRIVDPWGHFWRYRSADSTGAQNSDFDLWSIGRDGKTNPDPKHQDCADDIRNF